MELTENYNRERGSWMKSAERKKLAEEIIQQIDGYRQEYVCAEKWACRYILVRIPQGAKDNVCMLALGALILSGMMLFAMGFTHGPMSALPFILKAIGVSFAALVVSLIYRAASSKKRQDGEYEIGWSKSDIRFLQGVLRRIEWNLEKHIQETEATNI